MSRGAIYIAYGHNAIREAQQSIKTLRATNKGLAVTVISDKEIPGVETIKSEMRDKGGRWQKLNLDSLSPYDPTLLIDADTEVRGNLSGGFSFVDPSAEGGWDMALTLSRSQGQQHLSEPDREATRRALGIVATKHALALQCGVMFFRKSEGVKKLFAAWREEWARFSDKDQGAFLRALNRAPLKLWILGRCWNGGKADLVYHRFGRAVTK